LQMSGKIMFMHNRFNRRARLFLFNFFQRILQYKLPYALH
jgi:hypothetical protein